MQTMYALAFGKTFRRDMPSADAVLTSGITWGRFDDFTVAYWCGQTWQPVSWDCTEASISGDRWPKRLQPAC